jgi:hypothetical protein
MVFKFILQEFQKQVVPSVFTHLGNTKPSDWKIPLLFEMDDDVVEKWIRIDRMFHDGLLPNSAGKTGDPQKLKRKHLVQNDFKMRAEDLDYLADQVLEMKVCVKSSSGQSQGGNSSQAESLSVAAEREKQIRAVKNELMLKYRSHPLPSKAEGFVPYTREAWDELAAEMNIGRSELETWVDSALNSAAGKKWLNQRTKPNVGGSDPTPNVLLSAWDQHLSNVAAPSTSNADTSLFDSKYVYRCLPDINGDLREVLQEEDIIKWRGEDTTDLYF